MRCKAVPEILYTVAGIIVEHSTENAKPIGYIEVYIYIKKPPVAVISSSTLYLPHSLATSFTAIL